LLVGATSCKQNECFVGCATIHKSQKSKRAIRNLVNNVRRKWTTLEEAMDEIKQ
jgi:hypothetical protein